MEFSQNQELVEVTSVNSAVAREYIAGLTTGTLNITGVTVLDNTDNKISNSYLIQEAIRRTAQTLRIRMTDDDGGTLQIAFTAIITNNTLARAFGTYSQSAVTLTITGEPVISAVIPDPGGDCVEDPLYKTTTPGAYSVSDVLLEQAGVVILAVEREGTGYTEVAGTPVNREFLFTGGAGNGTITFDSAIPFNSGEVIYILYKLT